MADFDVLEQLLEFKWRDVSFPVTDFDTDLEQDLAPHKFANRDGAHVEATGRAPLVFSATIPFRNFISPGANETWSIGTASSYSIGNQPLYPTVFRAFFQAMATRSGGILQHPEFGPIQCKPKSARCRWTSQRRDGADVTASWVESLDDTVADFQDILARSSPISEAQVACADVDDQIVQWDNVAVTNDGISTTFSQDVARVLSTFDMATILSSQYGASIDALSNRVLTLLQRVQVANDITAWPLVSSCSRLQSSLYDVKLTLLTSGRAVNTFVPQEDTTLAALAAITGSSMDDIIKLNTGLARSVRVPAGTNVRYYRKAA
jgi:hypothetical protein